MNIYDKTDTKISDELTEALQILFLNYEYNYIL